MVLLSSDGGWALSQLPHLLRKLSSVVEALCKLETSVSLDRKLRRFEGALKGKLAADDVAELLFS